MGLGEGPGGVGGGEGGSNDKSKKACREQANKSTCKGKRTEKIEEVSACIRVQRENK